MELMWGERPGARPSIFPTDVWERQEDARKAAGRGIIILFIIRERVASQIYALNNYAFLALAIKQS